MSHERTVAQLASEIEYISGRRILIRWMPFRGLYLQDKITGNVYGLGEGSKWRLLSPAEQEGVCRGLGLNEMIDLLGLDPPQDD